MYEGINQYRVYNTKTGQISVIEDFYLDEVYTYDSKSFERRVGCLSLEWSWWCIIFQSYKD